MVTDTVRPRKSAGPFTSPESTRSCRARKLLPWPPRASRVLSVTIFTAMPRSTALNSPGLLPPAAASSAPVESAGMVSAALRTVSQSTFRPCSSKKPRSAAMNSAASARLRSVCRWIGASSGTRSAVAGAGGLPAAGAAAGAWGAAGGAALGARAFPGAQASASASPAVSRTAPMRRGRLVIVPAPRSRSIGGPSRPVNRGQRLP